MYKRQDLYKITLDFNASHVHDLTVKYFDTIPTATTLHITKHGMLLATSEVGDQCVWRGVFTRSCFYQFVGLGEDDAAETSFSSFLAPDGSVQVPVFSPRALTRPSSNAYCSPAGMKRKEGTTSTSKCPQRFAWREQSTYAKRALLVVCVGGGH